MSRITRKRLVVSRLVSPHTRKAALITMSALLLQASAFAQVSRAQEAASCQFAADFASLRALIGATVVGDCTADELAGSANGDRFQITSHGLLIHSTGGWMAFTDGQSTWIDGPSGVVAVGPAQSPVAPNVATGAIKPKVDTAQPSIGGSRSQPALAQQQDP